MGAARPDELAVNGRPRPARGDGRRALLRAVRRVVARDGLDGVTYRSVGAEAGVTHGLVTYHFESLDAMLREALSDAAAAAIRSSALEPVGHEVEDLAADLAQLVREDADGQAFQFKMELESRRDPSISRDVRRIREGYREAVDRSLRRLGFEEDEALTRLVLATLDGLVLEQLITGDADATERTIQRLHEVLHLVRSADGKG